MSRRPKHKRAPLLIDLFAWYVLPAYTLLFAGSVTWFGTNFSVIAVTGETHYRGFFLWGLLAGGYFLFVLWDLASVLPQRGKWLLRLLAGAAVLCLAAALAVPYLPELAPRWADLHVVLAFTACTLLMAAVLFLLLYLRRRAPACARGLLPAWSGIVLGCLILFCLCGIISSALEIFFTLSTAHLVRILWRRCRGNISQI